MVFYDIYYTLYLLSVIIHIKNKKKTHTYDLNFCFQCKNYMHTYTQIDSGYESIVDK